MKWVTSKYYLPGDSESTILAMIIVSGIINKPYYMICTFSEGKWHERDGEELPSNYKVTNWLYIND